MRAGLLIARNTLREALRDRVLYLILGFAIVVILCSELLSLLSVGNRQRIVEDLSLFAIQLFGDVACVFLGISLLSKEIDRRTVFNVLSKPVSRAAFVVGKGAGLVATVLLVTGAMAAVFAVYMLVRFGGFHPALLRALALLPFEFVVVTAIALLFSSFTTTILSALLASASVVIGHVSHGLKLLAEQPAVAGTWGAKVAVAFYWLLPNLERFNLKAQAIYREPVTASHLAASGTYGLVYAAAIVLVTLVLFERRDFQ